MNKLNINKLKDYFSQITIDLIDLLPSNLDKKMGINYPKIKFDYWLDNGLLPDVILNQYFIDNGIVNYDVMYIVSAIYYKIMREIYIMRNKTKKELKESLEYYNEVYKIDNDVKCLFYIKILEKLINNK